MYNLPTLANLSSIIANVKNRYRKWLNDLPLDDDPGRWERIQQFVKCVNSTNKETLLKGWQKNELSEGLNVMEQMLENPDHEEELYLQSAMEELMLKSEELEAED